MAWKTTTTSKKKLWKYRLCTVCSSSNVSMLGIWEIIAAINHILVLFTTVIRISFPMSKQVFRWRKKMYTMETKLKLYTGTSRKFVLCEDPWIHWLSFIIFYASHYYLSHPKWPFSAFSLISWIPTGFSITGVINFRLSVRCMIYNRYI